MKVKEELCDKRTTMLIAMSHKDKVILKTIAAREGITVAALIHRWVKEHVEGREV